MKWLGQRRSLGRYSAISGNTPTAFPREPSRLYIPFLYRGPRYEFRIEVSKVLKWNGTRIVVAHGAVVSDRMVGATSSATTHWIQNTFKGRSRSHESRKSGSVAATYLRGRISMPELWSRRTLCDSESCHGQQATLPTGCAMSSEL